MKIMVTSVPTLCEAHRRALALLASAACPSTEWPRALLLIGLASIDAALAPKQLVGVFWCGQGEAEGLIISPTLAGYIRDAVPVVVLCRSYEDARSIAAAIETERAA